VDSTLQVDNATTLSSTLQVDQATTLSSTLQVDQATTLSSTLQVDNATTLSSTLNVTRATTLSSGLEVNGDVSLNGTLVVGNDVSFNRNAMIDNHVSVGTSSFSNSVSSLANPNESITFTVPLFLDGLKYFCTVHSIMIGDFDIGSSDTETDKTYYVRMNSNVFAAPYYIFSATPNGTALNTSSRLTLYRGNTYTFIKTDSNTTHPFNIGSAYLENNTGMYVSSTGTGFSVTGTIVHKYPLSVKGIAEIQNHLYVDRDLSLNEHMRVGGDASFNATLNVIGTRIFLLEERLRWILPYKWIWERLFHLH
jgi:cytoskeletal protein CcmA (bactofilin family)